MTSERLRRIIRSRWWVLALAGFLSVLAAALVMQSRNDAIPEYEAVAPITFNRLLDEVDDSAARERLDVANEIATSVNAPLLSTGVDPLSAPVAAEVVAEDDELRLLFIGRGASAAEASVLATTIRDRYLAAQQLDFSEELEERVIATAARLDRVVAEIAALSPEPVAQDIETLTRLRELRAEVDGFAALYGALTTELVSPRIPPRSQTVILADREAASEALRVAQDELSSLEFTVRSTDVESVEHALLLAEETQLRTALDAFIAQSIVEEPIGTVDPVDVHESGIAPTPLPVAIVIGLSVGLLFGLAGLIIVDRVRRPLWEPTELEPRYRLPEVAARPRSLGDSSEPWYETAPYGRRKAGIQELRSAVEGLPGFGDGAVVGVASLTGPSSHVHELAADLAAGLASSGSWALLIDADYGQPSDFPEYRRHNFELEDVVADPQDTLGEAARTADRDRDFLGVSISKRRADAADLLARPAFAQMLDTVQAMHDVVIVACPPTDSASYHVLSQRLDAMILVAVAGDPAPAEVVNALRTLEERRSVPAGVVLIRPRVGPISLIMNQIERPLPTPDPAPVQYWQWSKTQDVLRKNRSAAAASQDPRLPTEGVIGEDAWQGFATSGYTEPAPTAAPSGVGAATLAATPGADSDGGKPATKTERIKRRAFPKRAATEAPADDTGADGSPWSYRDESE